MKKILRGSQYKGQGVNPQNPRRDALDDGIGFHKAPDDCGGKGLRRRQREQSHDKRRNDAVSLHAADILGSARAVSFGDDRLRSLSHAVRQALHQRGKIDDYPIDCQRGRVEVFHNLIIEQHGEYSHGDIDDEYGKSRDENRACLFEKSRKPHRFQAVLFREKVRTENEYRQYLAERRRQPRALYAHIAHEHEKVIAADIEHPARNHGSHGFGGRIVVADKAREKLPHGKEGHGKFHPFKISLCQGQKGVVRAKQPQKGRFAKDQQSPYGKRDDGNADERAGKKFSTAPLVPFAPRLGHQRAAANAEQKPEA